MNKKEVAKLLQVLFELYPSVEVTNQKVELWEQCLENTEFSVAKQNIINHAKTSKYIPTIAEVRGTVNTGKEAQHSEVCEVTQKAFELFEPVRH